MLIQLNIKNFALIEEMTIDFSEGFNILSGETGAGKSIMIDAIDFVLGGKFSKSLIRTGEERTYVEALFTIENDSIKKILEELDIEYDDIVIVSRESHQNGKNLIKINGKSFITSQLRKLGCKLLDIHGQHQNADLLQRATHIVQLDDFIGESIYDIIKKFTFEKEKLLEVQDKIKRIEGNEDREKLLDYLKFQIEDIEKAKLKENEEENLKEEYNILANAEKINNALLSAHNLLNNNEEFTVINSLSKVLHELSSIENHFEKIKSNKESIEGAFYTLEECSREIRDMAEEIVFDNDALEKVNSRIYEINQYKKKYAPSIPEILEYHEKIKREYDEIINSEKIIKELKEKELIIINKMKEISLKLHEIRSKKAKELQENILSELKFVGLEKSRMEIRVEIKDNFNERGFDEVIFFISQTLENRLCHLKKSFQVENFQG